MVTTIAAHAKRASTSLGREVLAPEILKVVGDVPRHEFVPDGLRGDAYADRPLPIGYGQTISQPFIGALMLDLLDLEPETRVLEVGTGFGYQAAVMADMGAEVFSVEVVEEFAEAAKARFGVLGYDIEVRVGDGSRGWLENAPFDRILGTRLAAHSIDWLSYQIDSASAGGAVIGLHEGQVRVLPVRDAGELADWEYRRPLRQWWMQLRPIIDVLASRLAAEDAEPD